MGLSLKGRCNTTEQEFIRQLIGKRIVAVAWLPMPGFSTLFNLESITLEGGTKLEVWASDSRENVCARIKNIEEENKMTQEELYNEYSLWLKAHGLHDQGEPPENTFVGYSDYGEEVYL